MSNIFKNLPGGEMLSEEIQRYLETEHNRKLDEATGALREQVEMQLKEQFARQYEVDRAELCEAIERMVTDAVKEHAQTVLEERKSLKAERAKLTEAIKEQRSKYKTSLNEHTRVIEKFITQKVYDELKEFTQDQHAIKVQRVRLSQAIVENKTAYKKAIREHIEKVNKAVLENMGKKVVQLNTEKAKLAETRKQLNTAQTQRLNLLEGFVINRVNREMKEFTIDKRALQESRTRLINKSNKLIAEARREFIQRSAVLVESHITRRVNTELAEMKFDVKKALENDTGAQIFEAFAPIFMNSHLMEGSKINKLTKMVESRNAELTNTKAALDAQTRKTRLIESKMERTKILNELLSTLDKSRRPAMHQWLASTKTETLREAFQRYLPNVLNGNAPAPSNRRTLQERTDTSRVVEITGDRRNNLSKSLQEDSDDDIIHMQRLAGIRQ